MADTANRKAKLTLDDVARMLDLSAVKAEHGPEDVKDLAESAKLLQCKAVFALPAYVAMLRELLQQTPGILLASPVGFPSGGHTSTTKAAEARELVALGVNEIDMVASIGMIKAGNDQYVTDDIRAVIDAAGVPVKVILEVHHLDEDEICRVSQVAAEAGAAFIKTGTGWTPTGATLRNIALIKSTVGDTCGVKAAGGVRDLETLVEMYRRGATRFGVNTSAGMAIKAQVEMLPGRTVDVGEFLFD